MDNTKENLSLRDREILNHLVLDYIQTAGPVGSRTLSEQHLKKFSPATIRAILADLEQRGFLAQRHTSSGRIPTEKGLRFYVDTLIERRPLSDKDQEEIRGRYHLPEIQVRTLLQKTSTILAGISRYASLVLTPQWDKNIFKHMEFLPLSQGRLLGIFVTQSGMVENRVIETPDDFNFRELEKINNYCNSAFYGLTLEEAREKTVCELAQVKTDYDQLLLKALLLASDVLNVGQTPELLLEGEAQLLEQPEFADAEQLRRLMKTLEEKREIVRLLEHVAQSPEVQIFIGAESETGVGQHLSLVAAPYAVRGEIVGTLGVIGPTRMDYARVIPIVDFTAQLVGSLL